MRRRTMTAGGLALLLAAGGASAAPRHAAMPEKRPDLADALAGAWSGAVISDARGASHDPVGLQITRAGRNLIQIESDYPRLPPVQIPLSAASDAILSASPRFTVFYQRGRPDHLELNWDDASWSGDRGR